MAKPIREFRETHPLASLGIIAGVAGLVGYILGSSCSGNNNYLKACQAQLAAAQSYQGRVRAELSELVARRFGPEVLRGATAYAPNGNVDEDKTFTAYRDLLGQLVKESNAAKTGTPDASVAASVHYDGGSRAPMECPVSVSSCPPRPICPSIDTALQTKYTDCKDQLAASNGDKSKLKHDLESKTSELVSYVASHPAVAPTDCRGKEQKEYFRGYSAGAATSCTTKEQQRRWCPALKKATSTSTLSRLLHNFVDEQKRPIQVLVSDPRKPETAEGIIREFCGADEPLAPKFVNNIDASLTALYGPSIVHPTRWKKGRLVCYKTENTVVRIGIEYLPHSK